MKTIYLVLFCITSLSFSQVFYQDVVYLKNGSVIRGVIIEQIPNKSLKIQTADKSVFFFLIEDITKFGKEQIQPKETNISYNHNENTSENNNLSNFEIGINFGASKNFLSGDCDLGNLFPNLVYYDYSLNDGRSSDFFGNLFFIKTLNSTVDLFTSIGIRYRSLNFTKKDVKRLIAIPTKPDPILVNCVLEQEAKFSYLDFHLLLKSKVLFSKFSNIQVITGFGILYNISSELGFLKEILKDSNISSNYNYIIVPYANSTDKYPNLTAIIPSFDIGLSYEINLVSDFSTSVALMYSYPFSNVDTKNSLKISNIILNLGISKIF